MDKRFQWTSFYMELASALLKYKNNRNELIEILETIFADAESYMRTSALLQFSVPSIKVSQMLTVLHC